MRTQAENGPVDVITGDYLAGMQLPSTLCTPSTLMHAC